MMTRKSLALLLGLIMALVLALALQGFAPNPEPGKKAARAAAREARIDDLLARMSLEQKIGQLIMPDIASITPADMRAYHFGTILNGGNSAPGNNERAPPADWLALADAYWEASISPRGDGGPAIPVMWATDAVHGHNNIVGATIFPHNIALGATHNAGLVRRISEATATEIAATGIDWAFAPTIAVARDDRWGRTYESFSENPALVARLGAASVIGFQGRSAADTGIGPAHVLSTAKHFFGDGGTGGRDQGDTIGETEDLVRIHARPYPAAIKAGAQVVMASFSSVNGQKMHASKAYLTGLLKEKMGFDGLVVGDWNGHGQIPGCTNSNCPQALLAGLDIYMVAEEWKPLYANLLAQVRDGTIPMARVDDAVRRILRVKMRYGLFDKPKPSARVLAGKFDLIGAPAHRAIAREAVRKSLVLLKNQNGVLPIRQRRSILVVGEAARSLPVQSGGWSITWQGGGDLTNADFPGGQTIFDAIAAQAKINGSPLAFSPDGQFSARPDVAIVVFGEQPYAEFIGDAKDLILPDARPLAMMRALKANNIPVVAVLLSGRPLWMNREINAADAFVAAWLPGTEGAGLADLLLRAPTRLAQRDFVGTLPFSWPASCTQFALNAGEPGYAPLFPLGYGQRYARPQRARMLDERCALLDGAGGRAIDLIKAGRPALPFGLELADQSGKARGPSSPAGHLRLAQRDRNAQEDSAQFTWSGPAALTLRIDPGAASSAQKIALQASKSLVLEYLVRARGAGPAQLALECGAGCSRPFDVGADLALAAEKGWRTARISLSCFGLGNEGLPADPLALTIRADAGLIMELSSVRLSAEPGENACRL